MKLFSRSHIKSLEKTEENKSPAETDSLWESGMCKRRRKGRNFLFCHAL